MQEPQHAHWVTCGIEMRFAETDLVRVVDLLVATVGRTQVKRGCRECVVARDEVDKSCIRYSEKWDSEAFFKRHVRSDEFRHVLVAMDMCCEEPKVTIGNLSGQTGIAHLCDLCRPDASASEERRE